MKRFRGFVTGIIVLILIFIHVEHSFSQDNYDINNRVYIIIVNKLTLTDIEKMPNLMDLIEDGSIGLMNVRGLNGYRGAESFLTINASNKAFANYDSSQFHNVNDEIRALYENRVGPMDGDYEIANIQMGRIYNQNEDNKYSPSIGALGNLLHQEGLKTAVFGNSDTDEQLIRTAALIPMDSKGLVDYGNVDDILIEDSNFPYGIRTDYDKILDEISRVESKASLMVVDTGDLNRLNKYSSFLSLDEFKDKRDDILNLIDDFIGNLSSSLDKENSLLMVLSPNSGEEKIDGNRLSPIIIWGRDVKRGILISNTTRRMGIIANLDISPTIVNFLGIYPKNMVGNPIEYAEKEDGLTYIKSINGPINLMSKTRSKTLSTYGTLCIILILLVVALMVYRLVPNKGILQGLRISLLLIYSLPLVFILISLFKIDSLPIFIVGLILLSGLGLYILTRLKSFQLISIISYFYFILLVLDIILNGFFSKYSVLSHDPIIGARYFGIGNEMVGLFLIASTITAGWIYEKFDNKIIPMILMLGSTVLVGHPNLGANVGGTIAFLSASIYFIYELLGKRLNIKNLVITFLLIGFAIGIFAYVDIKLSNSPTHLGSTLLSINEKGIHFIRNIIDRKLLMNIRLLSISFWTRVLMVNIFIQTLMSIYYKKRVMALMESRLGKGYLSCIMGSIVGFLVNDSGLILSAISINMLTILLIYTIISDDKGLEWDVELNWKG